MNLPAYALWKDESIGVPNKALVRLLGNDDYEGASTEQEFYSMFEVWTEDFKEVIKPQDFPIVRVCRTGKSVELMRIGMKLPKTAERRVFEINGEAISDEKTGEFLGGIVVLKDVTLYTNRIAAQQEQNERQFETIANMIPNMIWTTTPTGMHDWFSQRWYDYTGLTPEQSLGNGWRLPFHPEDMPATGKRWAHSLATGVRVILKSHFQPNYH